MGILILLSFFALWLISAIIAIDIDIRLCRGALPNAKKIFKTFCPIVNTIYAIVLLCEYDEDFRKLFD